MTKIIALLGFSVLLSFNSLTLQAAKERSLPLSYYLQNSATYDRSVPTPQSVLGYQVGEWHVRPEQLVQYYQTLAQASDRVEVRVIGYSHEKRPLILAFVSSPKNIAKLEEVSSQQIKNDTSGPMVTWMGYSVHGNEASGSNASMLFAYHMAASQDPEVLRQLDDQVIIIDPNLNPDGLARFAHWVNSNKSQYANPDPNDREHNEAWPSGRTNHYWFDLNRDWLLLRHPESRARIQQFHLWRPHVLTDFHEMGTNSSYFFQPGVPSRQNPLTPDANFKMTATIAEHHAKALDDIGSLYYSKENFDDFYYGKGSTYPDVHGSVGILFEQASARGHRQKSVYGEVTFPFAIKNHLTTSLSTIAAVQANQKKLKAMRSDFISETQKMAKDDKERAVVIYSEDKARLQALRKLMASHRIEVHQLAENLKINGRTYPKGKAIIVPLQQDQYRLIKSLFEHRKTFKDQVFYDVSTWNMGDAFDVDFDWVSRSKFDQDMLASIEDIASSPLKIAQDTIALAFDWRNMNTAKLLVKLQSKGLRVQGVTKPATYQTAKGKQKLSAGSLLLPLKSQDMDYASLVIWLERYIDTAIYPTQQISSGLALAGGDIGSPSIPVMPKVKPLLLTGDGVSSYDAGEVWYWLDTQLNQPVTLINKGQISRINLSAYSHLIIPGGRYQFDEKTSKAIETWVRDGGVIIAHSGGAEWLVSQGWTSSENKEFDKPVDTRVSYQQKDQIDAKHVVGGAIVSATIDTAHPLAFGLDDQNLSIFKRGDRVFSEGKESFVSIARFDKQPHRAGYMSSAVAEHLAEGTSILVQRLGRGRLIAFSDNPLFRGFWLGTGKVFNNALFYAKAIEAPQKTKEKTEKTK